MTKGHPTDEARRQYYANVMQGLRFEAGKGGMTDAEAITVTRISREGMT